MMELAFGAVDMSVDHEQVLPAIVVQVSERQPPSDKVGMDALSGPHRILAEQAIS